MKMNDLCPSSKKVIKDINNPHPIPWHEADYGQCGARPEIVKNIRVTCPRCGRRMMASYSTCHDGCCLRFYVPAHKPKRWWKRKKSKNELKRLKRK